MSIKGNSFTYCDSPLFRSARRSIVKGTRWGDLQTKGMMSSLRHRLKKEIFRLMIPLFGKYSQKPTVKFFAVSIFFKTRFGCFFLGIFFELPLSSSYRDRCGNVWKNSHWLSRHFVESLPGCQTCQQMSKLSKISKNFGQVKWFFFFFEKGKRKGKRKRKGKC